MTADFPSVMSILWVVSRSRWLAADNCITKFICLFQVPEFMARNFDTPFFCSASTSHTRSAAQRVPLHSWTGSFLPIPRFYHERSLGTLFFVLQVNISRARRCVRTSQRSLASSVWTGSCRTSRLIEPGVVDMIKKRRAHLWWWWLGRRMIVKMTISVLQLEKLRATKRTGRDRLI